VLVYLPQVSPYLALFFIWRNSLPVGHGLLIH